MHKDDLDYSDVHEMEVYFLGVEDGQMIGLKAGFEVANDIAKREGYKFSFPDPEKIKIKLDDANSEENTIMAGCPDEMEDADSETEDRK